jgi:hypothetical protein
LVDHKPTYKLFSNVNITINNSIIWGDIDGIRKAFNQKFLYDLSFFNFENAITATYFADSDLNIIKVNKNFRSLFNSDVTLEGQNLLTLLGLLDVAQSYISEFKQKLNDDGKAINS